MEYILGVALALAVCGAAFLLGMDRDRVFYPTILIVIASYYILFAVMAGDDAVLLTEVVLCTVFAAVPWPGSSAACGLLPRAWQAMASSTSSTPRIEPSSFSSPGWRTCTAVDLRETSNAHEQACRPSLPR